MDNNFLCTPIKAAALQGCDENYVNPVKTIEIGHAEYDEVKGIIEEHRAAGKPLVFHVGDGSISIANEVALAVLHDKAEIGILAVTAPKIPEPIQIKNYLEPLPVMPGAEQRKQLNEARELTFKDMSAADIPEEKKKQIAAEYMRLCKKYPNWKAHKVMRKAGEKYKVKFKFDDK